jgi:hypothetical protein
MVYGLLPILFLVWVFPQILGIHETVLNGRVLKDVAQLERDVADIQNALAQPASNDPRQYFDILARFQELDLQCELYMARVKGAPVLLTSDPCVRFHMNYSYFQTNLFNTYRNAFDQIQMGEAKEQYAQMHPGWEEQSVRHYSTVWHGEEARRAYLRGVVLALCFVLVRLWDKGFVIWFEVIAPRFWLAVTCWPIALFLYPGDPTKQLRDLLRTAAYYLAGCMSCFGTTVLKAADISGSKSSRDTNTSLTVRGVAQVVAGGTDPEWVREGFVRLTGTGVFTAHWTGSFELGLTRFDWDHGRVLRQAYIEYADESLGTFRMGRFFPVAGWTTPSPSTLETGMYPRADPSRGEATGVQWSHSWGPVTGYVAYTGVSGQAAFSAETIAHSEVATRIEWKVSPTLLLAHTFQYRVDSIWSSVEFRYTSAIHPYHLRGVLYGGVRNTGEDFVSGYVLGSYAYNAWIDGHVQYDRGLDTHDRVTAGVTIKAGASQQITTTFDAQYDATSGDLTPFARVQFAF